MTSDSVCRSPAPSSQGDYAQFPPYQNQGDFARTLSLNRSNSSALDMRQLTHALSEAREGSGQVRDALLSAGFRPRLPGLTKIVSKLSKEGSWRKALEVYEVVDELGLRPDTALTNSAISACDKGGRWQKALEIFDRMGPLGLHRDAITYSATISALAKGKQWHAALQTFDHMQLHGVEADVVTCCSLINALERGGQWQLAEKLFLEMCTMQEEQEQLEALVRTASNVPPGLGLDNSHTMKNKSVHKAALLGGAPSSSPPSLLMRSHTSPSSVLLALRSGSTGYYGNLPSVDETGTGTDDVDSPPELNLTLSLSTQRGILDALVADGSTEENKGGQKDVRNKQKAIYTTPITSNAIPIAQRDAQSGASQTEAPDGDDLATAFARVTSLSTPSPSESVDHHHYGFDRVLSATLSGQQNNNNPVAAAAGRVQTSPPPPPPGLTRPGSAASALGSAYSHGASIADSEFGTGSFAGMSPAAAPFISSGGGGRCNGVLRNASLPPPPPSRLQRGTFGREPPVNGPVQAAAAAHLRRAMSCFPDFDCNDSTTTASAAYGSMTTTTTTSSQSLTATFNFSHATRVSPNRVCCNALLAAYARAKPPQWQRALHLLTAMWSGGPTLTPDVVSYNTALKACANAFQLSKGLEIYHEMRRNCVCPNATSYICLIAAASDASNKEVMQEIGNWLTTSPTEVKATCMNSYVTGLVKVGLWNEALTQFQTMLTPNSPAHPTSATFCAIMAGHMSTGDYPAVQRTFEYMRSSGVSPNIVAFNTLLASLAATGNWTSALSVLNAALAAAVEGVHANTATFNTVLAALFKGAIAPNAVQQYPFLASQAVQVYQQMQAVRGGAAPDSATFNTLIAILDATKHSTQVVAVYNLMLGAGLTPDDTASHKVLSAAMTTGQIAKAVHVTQSLLIQNASIEPQQLSTLLSACVSTGSWDLATQLCSAANSPQGLATAAAMFNFVLHSAFDGGQFSLAMEIIHIMQSKGIKVDKNIANSIIQGGGVSFSGGGKGVPGGNSGVSGGTACSSNFPNTPQLASIPGANLSPETRFPPSSLSGRSINGCVVDEHCQVPRMRTEAEGYITPTPGTINKDHYNGTISDTTASITSTTSNRTLNKKSEVSVGGVIEDSTKDYLTLVDTNALVASLESTGDAVGRIEVLTNMNLIGIMPDYESYHHLIAALVNAREGAAAVDVCKRGHTVGVLKHVLPQMFESFGEEDNLLVDLRGCGGQVAVTVAVMWLLELKRREENGDSYINTNNSNLHDHVFKFLFGPLQQQGGKNLEPSCNKVVFVDWHAVRGEVQRVLTTGHSSLYPGLSGVSKICISSDSIKFAVDGPCAILEVQPPLGMASTWSAATAGNSGKTDGGSAL